MIQYPLPGTQWRCVCARIAAHHSDNHWRRTGHGVSSADDSAPCSRCKRVGWVLAGWRSAGRIRADERSGRTVGGRCKQRRFDLEAGKGKMVAGGTRPLGSLRAPAAATVLAAAIEGTEGSFRRGGRRYILCRTLRPAMMAVRRGLSSGRRIRERPARAVHAFRRSDARQRKRPKPRHEHKQQQEPGSPTMHVGYVFPARIKYEPSPTVGWPES